MKFKSLAVVLSAFLLTPAWLEAQTPADVLDLSRWKLTLPLDRDRDTRPDEIHQPALDSFQDPSTFFVNDRADGVIFRAYCGGITTKGSQYPRCELREMDASGNKLAAWSSHDGGVHTLSTTMAILQTPPKKKHVVCAQIHDAEDDVLMIRLEGSKLLIERNSNEALILDRNYQLGTRFDIYFEATGGQIAVWHNGEPKLDWKIRRAGCYLKVGCYTQSNREKGDEPDSYGEVIVYRLKIEHR